jgi:hypothetical protein
LTFTPPTYCAIPIEDFEAVEKIKINPRN